MSWKSRYQGFLIMLKPCNHWLCWWEPGMVWVSTHGWSSHECGSTWVSNKWLMHAQTISISGPATQKKTINTRRLRDYWIGFSQSRVSPDQPPALPVALGSVCWVILPWACQSSLNNCLRERLFESYSVCLVV